MSKPKSIAKAEKVVKPPRNPVVRKDFTREFGCQKNVIKPARSPIAKHPNILMLNICKGIWHQTVTGMSLDNNTREIAPKAAPNPITK